MPSSIEPRKPGGRRKPILGEEHLVTRPGSPVWHYDFTIDGRRFRGSCGTADFALAAADAATRHDASFREIRLGEKPAQHLSLNDAFCRHYLEVGKGTSYGETAQKHQFARILRELGRDTRLADLDDVRINDLVQALRSSVVEQGPHAGKTLSGSTINRYLTSLSAVCTRAREFWGVEVGGWSLKRHRQAEPPPQQRFIEHDAMRDVLRGATPHIRPVMMLDVMTGARKANMVGLRWEEVSLPARTLTVVGKGDKRLTIPLPDQAVTLLERLQPEPAQRKGPVFTYGNPAVACDCSACKRFDLRGKQFKDPKRSIKTAFTRAGLPRTTRFHDLRHTFASWLLAEGGDLRMVQEALHHADVKTTMRYAGVMAGRKAAVLAGVANALVDPPKPTVTAEVVQLPAPKTEGEAA
jgi:integrase